MHMAHSLFAGALLATAALGAPARASICDGCTYLTSYEVTHADYDVGDIAIMEQWPGGGSITNSFDVWGGGSTTIINPFPKDYPVTSAFLLGVAQDLPGDPEGQKHLVIFANLGWVNSAEGIAFGTLLPTVLEANLITALENIGGASTDETVLHWSYDTLFGFSGNEAFNGPNGDLTFTPGDAFALIAFSDGQVIGQGVSSIAAVPPPVPEPASWALMIAGFGLIGAGLRRGPMARRICFA